MENKNQRLSGKTNIKTEQIKLERNFERIYRNFRLNIYKHIFEIMGEREGSLTVTEFFAVETIGLMENPTVSEFAECLSITSSHAAYKVHRLMEKGYIKKFPRKISALTDCRLRKNSLNTIIPAINTASTFLI